jgi:hypothetical protein
MHPTLFCVSALVNHVEDCCSYLESYAGKCCHPCYTGQRVGASSSVVPGPQVRVWHGANYSMSENLLLRNLQSLWRRPRHTQGCSSSRRKGGGGGECVESVKMCLMDSQLHFCCNITYLCRFVCTVNTRWEYRLDTE